MRKCDDYQWQLLDASQDSSRLLAVSCDIMIMTSSSGLVTLTREDGSLLTALNIRNHSFFTVVKFKWQNKSYRYGVHL